MSKTALVRRKPQPDYPAQHRPPAPVVTALREGSVDGERRLRFALRAARMYVWERDMTTKKVVRFGEPADVLGVHVDSIEDFIAQVHGEDREEVRTAIEGVVQRCEPYELEFRFLQSDGSERWVRDIGRRVHTDDGDRFLGVCIDVTAEVQARRTALRLAFHDPLTGLANRIQLSQRLTQASASLREGGEPVAVVCIDLDGFKSVNDSYGHAAGDELLRRIASLLQSACRPGDVVARFGGDEFVLLLQGGDPRTVERIARTLLARAQEPFELEDGEATIGFSIGAALAPQDGADAEMLLQRADVALYRAKSTGRGNLCFYRKGMDREAQRRRRLERELRGALTRGELALLYQPLIDVATGRTLGVEALMRWTHPELGQISPAEFIPIAEVTGLIVPIGEWALRTACEAGAAWPGLRLSVNVSVIQFRHPGFIASVATALAASGLPPARLELEITESVLLHDTEDALATFRRLKSLGIGIAMDDFGTGYSSLSYLSRFAFDKIKIDGSFTRTMGACNEAAAIVRSVLNLGHTLEMRINAESVETQEQLEFLRREGCDEVQGFLFSPAVSASEIAARVAAEEQSCEG